MKKLMALSFCVLFGGAVMMTGCAPKKAADTGSETKPAMEAPAADVAAPAVEGEVAAPAGEAVAPAAPAAEGSAVKEGSEAK